MNGRIKKVIYLEMLILSLLLVVAVVVVSRMKLSASPDTASTEPTKTTTENSTITETEPKPTWKTYPEDRALTANQYFVYDCIGQKFLLNSTQANERIYPANITKLFTAYIIIETNVLGPNSLITAEEAVLALVPENSPVAHIQAGDKLNGRQLMEGMLLCSGNDATYILAVACGRKFADQATMAPADAIDAFIQESNRIFKEKGMLQTNMVNPEGTHDKNHYTTFHDLVILSNLCMQYNTVIDPAIVAEADIRLHGETIIWENANKLINTKSEFFCPHAIGLMAGPSSEGANDLLAAFKKDGQYLLVGTFGCPTDADRFDDALQLFNQYALK